jgi:hypothetical protein
VIKNKPYPKSRFCRGVPGAFRCRHARALVRAPICAAAPRWHGTTDAPRRTGRPAESMGLLPHIFNALRRKGYRLPTPVQRKAIPLIMAGACFGSELGAPD